MNDDLTAEQIQKHYDAAVDSVNLLNAGKPSDMSDDDWTDTVSRNVGHLKIMVAKDYWTNESMTAVNSAITAGNGYTAS